MGVPQVSVIIPCFNGETHIRDALHSVALQSNVDLEVIVIDDGSTDDSARIVEREFPAVRLVRTENRGVSAARNLATELASGQYLQYLDADDVLAPDKLSRQMHAFLTSRADVAYGMWQRIHASPDSPNYESVVEPPTLSNPEIALFTDFWCPPAVYLFTKHIVGRVGGFRDDLPIIQDARFVLDCALHGATFIRCDGLMAYYRVHDEGSVSTRDPIAFVRDCLHNATQVEDWWQQHGGIDDERRSALLRAFGYVARGSFEADRSTFEAALSHLHRLDSKYIPRYPRHLALASRVVGYRNAEHLALTYRRLKRMARGRRAEAHGR